MTGQEKLPDGLECCFKALAKAVFSEEGTVYFHRTFISFDGSDRTRVITRYANTAMEKGGDIAVAARAVMIYPAIKWLLKAREIEAVIAALPEEAAQGDFCRLVGMQSMLVRLTGEKPEMRLQVRREFFERCQEFTDVVFKAVLESVYRKSTRKNMARPRLAMLLLGEDDGVAGQEEISTHTIKTYYLEIIEAVAAHSGELRCMKEPYIRNMFIKNAAAFLLSIFVGVVAVIAAKTGTALLPVLFMALYFLVSAIGVAWNAAAGRYVVVRAAAVACEEQRDAVRQKRSVYRFIPVDEDGNYLSEQGAYDIFLDFASKKKSPRFNFFIGRTYVLVFHIDNSRQLNERTLAAVYTG